MAEPVPDSKLLLLREDLSKEYYAILDVVSSYDGWLLVVKGWSVTLSLAGLGLGFQERHFSLFALAAATGAAFWYMDGLMKGFQYRYYVRMREIEYSSYLINSVQLGGAYGELKISAPRIDMTWSFKGYAEEPEPGRGNRPEEALKDHPDWRADTPWRRTPQEINQFLRYRFLLPNVWLPHALAVALGAMLFTAAAALNASGTVHLHL
jgi:hypothetical protein